jgi:hypothetical protein
MLLPRKNKKGFAWLIKKIYTFITNYLSKKRGPLIFIFCFVKPHRACFTQYK